MAGQAYSFLGNRNEAEAWYQKSLQANSTHVPAHLTFARHLAAMVTFLCLYFVNFSNFSTVQEHKIYFKSSHNSYLAKTRRKDFTGYCLLCPGN